MLTKASLEAWIVTMRERHDSPGGINVRIRAANSYLSWLRAGRHLEEPLKLRLLKAPLLRPTLLTRQDMSALLAFKPKGRVQRRVLSNCLMVIDEKWPLQRRH